MAPIGCAEAVQRLWERLQHGLDGPDERAVDEHLAWCMRCCGELAFAEEVQRLLRTRTADALPADVAERLEAVIDRFGGTGDAEVQA